MLLRNYGGGGIAMKGGNVGILWFQVGKEVTVLAWMLFCLPRHAERVPGEKKGARAIGGRRWLISRAPLIVR